MIYEDLRKIVAIMLTADGGCSTCAASLIRKFCQAFGEEPHTIWGAIQQTNEYCPWDTLEEFEEALS